jgi:hypothetical protein
VNHSDAVGSVDAAKEVAQALVSCLRLLQRVLEQAPLRVVGPGARQLVLVEDPEPHRANGNRGY